jgi:DNA-binding transcriptional LysR family regulator
MLDLRALSYFVAVHEEGSITAAAKRCYIAQPSITNALQALEAKFGCRLFERTRRGSFPTPEGERLYRRSIALLAEARAIEQELGAAKERRVLKLYVQADILLTAIRPLLNLMYRYRSELRIVFCAGPGEADMVVMSSCGAKVESGFNELWREDYVLAVPATHPLRFHGQAGLDVLRGLDLIDRPHCFRYAWFKDKLLFAGIEPNIVAQANSEETLLALLKMGVGSAILPELHFPPSTTEIALVRFMPEVAVSRSVGFKLNGRTVAKILDTTVNEFRSAAVAQCPRRIPS